MTEPFPQKPPAPIDPDYYRDKLREEYDSGLDAPPPEPERESRW